MSRQIFLLTISLFAGTFFVQAQSKQDSLFLQQLGSSPLLVEGKAYLLETEKQKSTSEYQKSQFLRDKEKPVFLVNGDLANGLPYAVFGSNPIVFNGIKTDKIKIDNKEYPCQILSFTCNGKKYKTCELGLNQTYEHSRYSLMDADFLKAIETQLVGKTLYTKTANWQEYHEDRMNSNRKLTDINENTCKYCPVTVSRVVQDYDEKYIVLFRKMNQNEEYCFGGVGFDSQKTGSFMHFTQYFTFENPQTHYPDITQERWEQIMAQAVKKGFASDEVKIAFGPPDKITTEDEEETWIYYNHNKKDYAVTINDGIVTKVISQSASYY
jgi:hypothetical protein